VKVILVISDSFRRDHIGAYGNTWIRTPNIDRLASCSSLFEDMFLTSFPTGPFRQDVLLGKPRNEGMPFNMWDPLEPKDVTVPAMLEEKGIVSQLITDVANCVTRGRNYFQGFTAWHVNRGQEGDPCLLDDTVPLTTTCAADMIRYPLSRWHQVLMNRAHRKVETDWFAPGTIQMAIDWLNLNYRREDFFLWIDVFDPHEPWDPPQHYVDLYDPDFKGTLYEAPTYGHRKKMGITNRELKQIRARYAGECTMVDTSVGQLLAAVERLGIADDTAVIFTTDHGIYLDYPGDGGLICKPHTTGKSGRRPLGRAEDDAPITYYPMYPNLANTPLIIHLPGQQKGKRVKGYVQARDLMATILDLFRRPTPTDCLGSSLLPMMEGKRRQLRDHATYGYTRGQAQVCDRRWLYASWSGSRPCKLFDRRTDPNITKNVAAKHPDVVARLHRTLVKDLRQAGASDEYVQALA